LFNSLLAIIHTFGSIARGDPAPEWTGVLADKYREDQEISEYMEVPEEDEMAEKGGRMRRSGIYKGTFGPLLGLALVAVTAEVAAADAAVANYAGTEGMSNYAQDMYRDIDNNMSGYDDLDAALAALQVSGDTEGGAVIAVGVFYEAQDAYSQ